MPITRFALLAAIAWMATAHAAPLPAAAAASDAPKETWALATEGRGRDEVIYRFIDELGPKVSERAAQGDRIALTWRYESANGMPSEADKSGMDALEDLLEPLVERDGFSNLALVSTGAGVREWTYYATSGGEFLQRLRKALPGHPEFAGRVRIEVRPDPQWTAYEDFRGHLAR